MCICIFPCFPSRPMCFFFFIIQHNPQMTVGITVNIMNMAAKNNITISCANSSITVPKRNAILKGHINVRNGAITGHNSILNGRNISLIRPILLTSLILVSSDASRSRLAKSHST
jgi:RNase P/RNase MRP subunit p29